MNSQEYELNKDAYFRRARKSYLKTFNSPEERLHRMVSEAKSRAKKRGLAFDIEPLDITWNNICPILRIPITIQKGKGRGGDNHSPSLDRIDNTLGYVKGNVRIISNRANKLKNNMTQEEAVLLVKNWKEI